MYNVYSYADEIGLNHNIIKLQCLLDLLQVTSWFPLISNVCVNAQWYNFLKLECTLVT